jgi:glycosyltransferase involved in cell wall biosynthesis
MMKKLCVVSCPIDTSSGYGSRSRDFVRSLIKLKDDIWDIKILAQKWGNTPWGALDSEKDIDLISRLTPNIPKKPDVWIQVTVPNEFQPVGTYNIGVTAGIETTICPPQWIEGCNRMNLVLTSSNHSKKVFETSVFQVANEQGQPTGQELRLTSPVEVLFEGFNTNIYKHVDALDILPSVNEMMESVKEKFAFLLVGHWLPGDVGEDRKNIGLTIKTFLEAFKTTSNPPALVIKTSLGNNSIIDKSEIKKRIYNIKKHVLKNPERSPNVYLIHGELSDEEMNCLYNHPKVKAHINLTKGEGFGRPLLEASLSKKPIIASNWSGHLDFLPPNNSVLVKGTLTNVHESSVREQGIMKEAQWFSFFVDDAKKNMKEVFNSYNSFKEKSIRQYVNVSNNFTWNRMTDLLSSYIEKYVKLPEVVQLKLPQLKKIELPKLSKINKDD